MSLFRPAVDSKGILTVNGTDAGPLRIWNTGGKSTWAWDRTPVQLKKGVNRIRIAGPWLPAVDHLNVLEAVSRPAF